jgi:multidrug efflux pump subunit AcrA (membrane-fusion protein)
MQKLYRPIIPLVLLCVLLLALAACNSGLSLPGQAQPTLPPPDQPTATSVPPTPTPAESSSTQAGTLSYTGDVRARAQVSVIPKVGGRIEEVRVDVGDRVKAGDVVIVLEHEMLDAQVEQAEAGLAAVQANLAKMQAGPRQEQVAMAEANLEAAQARYDLLKQMPFDDQVQAAEHNLELAKNALWQAQSIRDVTCANADGVWQQVPGPTGMRGMLVAPGGNCTAAEAGIGQAQEGVELAKIQLEQVKEGPRAQDLAQAAAAVTAARESYDLAKAPFTDQDTAAVQAQVSGAQAAVELAKLNRDEAFVKAPIDGLVASKSAVVGAMAGGPTAGAPPLLTLVSEDAQVVFSIEESLYSQVKVGQAVTLSVTAYPGETFTGKIATIAPVADPVARTFEVTVYPDDHEYKLRSGMFVVVTLEAGL